MRGMQARRGWNGKRDAEVYQRCRSQYSQQACRRPASLYRASNPAFAAAQPAFFRLVKRWSTKTQRKYTTMLTNRQFANEMPYLSSGVKDRGMALIGFALHPVQTYRWLQFLKDEPMLGELARRLPHLITRIHRPYVSPALNCEQRVDLLIDHYKTLVATRFGDLVRRAALRPLTLHEFSGKSGMEYQVTLSAIEPGQQDGELVLRLISNGRRIYSASFFLATFQGVSCIRIGGLHGMLAVDNVIRIKRITRDLYGCRPKDLMVQMVREIGNCFGCVKLILIGNQNKLPPCDARVCRKSSDYDQLWKELNAVPRADGDYELPCASMCAEAADSPLWPNAEPAMRRKLEQSILAAIRARLEAKNSSSSPPEPQLALEPEIEHEAVR
jgi:uncharacterized protein VirK/YbjX